MSLTGIVYSSCANQPFDPETLAALEAHAVQRNAELDVTGYLYFEDGRFFQYIEGADETVSDLMQRIARDPRHSVVQTLKQPGLDRRRFPDWRMKFLQKRHFYGLESLLSDHLAYLQPLSSVGGDSSDLVWRMIDRIAALQRRLASA